MNQLPQPTATPLVELIFDRLATDDVPTDTAELVLAALTGEFGEERTVEIGPGSCITLVVGRNGSGRSKAHAHHALNEAADSLAHMARRRIEEPFDVRPRAHDVVEAFLRDWHVALPA
ncbi:hypothetical protein [Micromonospora sp. DT47]|uniref:hypothetical protein n=1 Tax=Micromonospora sp. DT47 TaxID=3393431 RepID=UPI003CE6B111